MNVSLKWERIIPWFFIVFTGIIAFLPFIAPILASIKLDKISDLIYKSYGLICHQKASRSAFLLDHQVAWCIRDSFIWFGLFSSSATTFLARKYSKFNFFLLIIFVTPMILDGGIQTIAFLIANSGQMPFYESTNLLRAITGGLFGLGVGFYLFPKLRQEMETEISKQSEQLGS